MVYRRLHQRKGEGEAMSRPTNDEEFWRVCFWIQFILTVILLGDVAFLLYVVKQ